MSPIRPSVANLVRSGIARIAVGALDDPEVIPLWFGESDIISPDFIREAAVGGLRDGETFYSNSRGTQHLRQALARYHQRIYGLDIADERIIVPGSTMLGVLLSGQCMLERGDEILLIGPYWPNIGSVAAMCGATTREVRLREGPERWWLDMEEVSASLTSSTKAVYVNTPSNPTGWIMSTDEQKALLDVCRKRGLGIISDEVYHRNVFSGRDPAPSFLELADENEPVFVVNGFSKGWCMTGWRLGWVIGPRNLAEPLAVLAECNNTGATVFAQRGGTAALDHGESFVESFRRRCTINRQLVLDIVGSHERVSMLEPEGAFYAFPRIDGVTDSLALARRILDECKVGVSPGYTFGERNDSHLRLCFAIETDRLRIALERIRELFDRL
ncbi:MAG: pyridoxal phosphate-dependent aminotransferase [Geminicoccaceae bacterium]|nr:pyridoxal phosphate-dependent aminotransferase [Geminicoccaceae bacterium]